MPSRAAFGRSLAGIVVGGVLLAQGSSAPAPGRPTHVILISVDTLSRSALRAFATGAPALAHLDAFCARASRFEDAHSTAPWTLPAHGSLLTGLYPDRHGATDARQQLAPDTTTLAESLRQAGFETVAFTDGGYVDRGFGFAEGFDRYDDWSREGGNAGPVRLPRNGDADVTGMADPFDRARSFLEQRGGGDRPLFLFLHTYAVHHYYRALRWAVGRSKPGEVRSEDYYTRCVQGRHPCEDEDWRQLEAFYAAGVDRLDRDFGLLLSALARAGLAETTAIILVSDHGEGFDPRRGRIHHGGRLHEDLIRIPMVVAGPGVRAGAVRKPVSLADVMPTILDWMTLAVPRALDGRSFLPELRGARGGKAAPIYAMEHYYWWAKGRRLSAESVRDEPLSRAVVDGGLWYIRGRTEEALYDMARDPRQTVNLVEDDRRLEPMKKLLRLRKELRSGGRRREADPQLEEKLRALGYLE